MQPRYGYLWLFLFVLIFFSTSVVAERGWMHVGQVDALDLQAQTVMIDDLTLKLTASSKIYASDGREISARLIQKGSVVGADSEYLTGIGRVIVELRIYPNGSMPRTEDED